MKDVIQNVWKDNINVTIYKAEEKTTKERYSRFR